MCACTVCACTVCTVCACVRAVCAVCTVWCGRACVWCVCVCVCVRERERVIGVIGVYTVIGMILKDTSPKNLFFLFFRCYETLLWDF